MREEDKKMVSVWRFPDGERAEKEFGDNGEVIKETNTERLGKPKQEKKRKK